MSVQESAARAPNPPFATLQPDPEADSSFDARWAAWIERGRHRDLAVKRKLRIALAGAVIIGLLVALFLAVATAAR